MSQPTEVSLVISMFGGSIDGIQVFGKDVLVKNVIFLEDPNYLQGLTHIRVREENGELGSYAICSHLVDCDDQIPPEEFDRVLAASRAFYDDVTEEEWERGEEYKWRR